MSAFTDAYEIKTYVTETGIDFFFVSEGKKDVFKFISYSYVRDFEGSPLYNLALLDYDHINDSFSDDQIANNGDTYKVFHTVLATVPYFLSIYENAIVIVQGSDSTKEFLDNCQLTCKKRCIGSQCKEAHRRINIYRNYVDKNFDELTQEYIFFGDRGNSENQILREDYSKGEKYIKVLLKKRKFD